VIARLLNGEELPRKHVDDPSPIPSYYVLEQPGSDGARFLVNVYSTARKPALFADGPVALTADRRLAERLVQKLNEIDPRQRPPAMRGTGWW
jgi:hypothetical protein